MGGRRMDAHLMDISPTILDIMGLPVPRDMEGKVIG
jgi:bisphosphoglycerate-independent phosphoglycerate mutase (AlkP superfamily)